MKAQAALEYMILTGVLMAFLAGVFAYSSQTSLLTLRTTQSTDAVRMVADAADRIYKTGGGNTTITVDIPAGVVGQTVADRSVRLSLRIGDSTGESYASTAGSVTGSMPTAQGRYEIVVEMLSSGVVRVRPL